MPIELRREFLVPPPAAIRGQTPALDFVSAVTPGLFNYALLQPSTSIQRVAGPPVGGLLVMRCDATERASVTIVGISGSSLGDEAFGTQVEHLRAGSSEHKIDVLYIAESPDEVFLATLKSTVRTLGATSRLSFDFQTAPLEGGKAYIIDAHTTLVTLLYDQSSPNPLLFNTDPFDEHFSLLAALEATIAALSNKSIKLHCLFDGENKASALPQTTLDGQLFLEAARLPPTTTCPSSLKIPATLNQILAFWKVEMVDAVEFIRVMLQRVQALGPRCSVCAAGEGLQRCAGCKRAFYCSVEHQREAWPGHRRWCEMLRNADEPMTREQLTAFTVLQEVFEGHD